MVSSPSPPPSAQIAPLTDAIPPFGGWSPDSKHFLARATDGSLGLYDSTGANLSTTDAQYGDWITANKFGVFGTAGPGRAIGRARFLDVEGNQLSEVPTEFESALFTSGSTEFAGESLAKANEAVGTSYRVWDGQVLSDLQEGVPLVWTPDGGLLVILEPLGPGNGPPGEEGTVAIVDPAGDSVFTLPVWVADERQSPEFSPDGKYMSACLYELGRGDETLGIHVVDFETHAVSSSVGPCYYSNWTRDNKLYVSGPSVTPSVWTPNSGVAQTTLPGGTFVAASPDGRLATWTDDVLHVEGSAGGTDYQISDSILWVDWSPDCSEIMITTDGGALELIESTGLTI